MTIEKILETLWVIRNDDKFYFMSYGEELIKSFIEDQFEKPLIEKIEYLKQQKDK